MIQEECQDPHHVNEVRLGLTTKPIFYLVPNVAGAASPVLCITFDSLHFTHNPRQHSVHTDFMHAGIIHLSQADISVSQTSSSDHKISPGPCVYITPPNRVQLEITGLCSV